MNRFPQIAFFALATFAVIFAGATTDRSTVAVLGQPGDGGGCSSVCSVGGLGTGGENSGGTAKGFLQKGATFPEHPGELVRNSGNANSGHLVATDQATGETIGTNSGGFAPGIHDAVGHSTFGGVCNGRQSRC
jgi:hypothetical protein